MQERIHIFEIPGTKTALDGVLQAIEEQKQPNYFDPVYKEQLQTIKTLLEKAMQSAVAPKVLWRDSHGEV